MRIRLLILNSAAALMLTANSGCTVIGVLIHNVFGEPPVDAQYDPQIKPTLVLVENYGNPDASTIDGDQIAHQVTEELKDHTKIPMIDPDKVAELRDEDSDKYHGMSIQAIGKAVDAKQVIVVDLLQSGSAADATGSVVHATATAHVRVVDIEKDGATLWPAGSRQGKELSASEDYGVEDTASGAAKHTKVMSAVSSRISKLFYRWNPENQDVENSGG